MTSEKSGAVGSSVFDNNGELNCNKKSLCTEDTSGNADGFANALTVWINKPHVVNRRLCGSRINYFEVMKKLTFTKKIVTDVLSVLGFTSKCFEIVHEEIGNNFDKSASEIKNLPDIGDDEIVVIVREMLPKQPERHPNIPELIIYDKAKETFTFVPLKFKSSNEDEDLQIELIYQFSYSKSSIQLCVNCTDFKDDSDRKLSLTWLQGQLLKKLARWCEQPGLRTSLTSLTLLSLEEYSRVYSELKNKYGLHFAKVWPEKTDPQKFVFEDVAIATYLLLLWKQDRERKGLTEKQSFVDLGCGNGLLVHILASEGHPGYGVDIRQRNIWSLYGPETVLKEQTITPSSVSVFPDCDWLIGNHSDELTPWIPVMAARSSYKCCFFVLPCCHFDFDCKFSYDSQFSQGQGEDGQYRTYLNFVKIVGEKCGFNVEEDVLRIPSTKRVCFVGRSRSYDAVNESAADDDRQAFISSRCRMSSGHGQCSGSSSLSDTNRGRTVSNTAGSEASSSTSWASDFVPREKTEVTRNCVTVAKETKDYVTQTVFDHLLQCENGNQSVGHDGKAWNKGGCVPVCEVVKLFDKCVLQELKSECGGLQTLLRNSSHIFQVSSGSVQLRDFTLDNPFEGRKRAASSDKGDYYKTVLCWFHDHHPDGCPRSTENCTYAHGTGELRPRPIKLKQKNLLCR